MARNLMGCTTADVAVAASNGALQPGSGPWPVYTTGPYRDTSVAITDLTDMAGTPITQVTFGADGVLRYYSPDGDTSTHWLDVGQGLRIAVRPVSIVGPAGPVGATGATGATGPAIGALLTAKGDLAGRDASAAVRVPVGADGALLVADSSQAAGVRWGANLVNGLDHRAGPGSPEGVRAAGVGSTWTQTDALALGGIVVWRKRGGGAGTTGWAAEAGETSDYDIAAGMGAGVAWGTVHRFKVCRVGALVILSLDVTYTTGGMAPASFGQMLPAGFRPAGTTYRDLGIVDSVGATTAMLLIRPSETPGLYRIPPPASGTRFRGEATFRTDSNLWPTVAP